MSQENVEIVRKMAEAFNSGDFETAVELLAPDIEYHELPGIPGAGEGVGVYHGREELVRWFAEFLGGFEEGFQSRYERISDVDETHVVSVENWQGVGVRSGIPVEMTAAALHTVRDGRIAQMRYFRTEAEALQAAGLSE
jgi:ketosteroid isomerase-like protein